MSPVRLHVMVQWPVWDESSMTPCHGAVACWDESSMTQRHGAVACWDESSMTPHHGAVPVGMSPV